MSDHEISWCTYRCWHLSLPFPVLSCTAPPSHRHTHACTCTNALLLSSSIIPPLFLHALPLHHCLPPLLCNLPGIPIPHLPRLPLFYPTPSLSLSLSAPNSVFFPARLILLPLTGQLALVYIAPSTSRSPPASDFKVSRSLSNRETETGLSRWIPRIAENKCVCEEQQLVWVPQWHSCPSFLALFTSTPFGTRSLDLHKCRYNYGAYK